MRNATAALVCLLAVVAGGCGDAQEGGGGASCAGPRLDDAHDTHRRGRPPPTVAPGASLALHGEGYTSTCNDTSEADDPLVPLPDVTLTVIFPDGSTSELGPFTPAGERMGFEARVEVPADMAAGDASVSDGLGGPPYAFRVALPDPATPSQALPEVVPWDGDGFAPPVSLDVDGDRLRLRAWSACFGHGCYDGSPRPPYAEVGEREAVAFSFPEAGWSFTASFRDAAPPACARSVVVPVRTTGPHTFEVTPAGPAGEWYVDLFGQGPDGGDVAATFRWTTGADGTFPAAATGGASVLAEDDGVLDAFGAELWVQDLATTPTGATARITVTAATGRSVTLGMDRRRGCTGTGSLSFTAPRAVARRALDLGPGPFSYDVALTFDGTTYHGTGRFPDDASAEAGPSVPLTWAPALPAYRG